MWCATFSAVSLSFASSILYFGTLFVKLCLASSIFGGKSLSSVSFSFYKLAATFATSAFVVSAVSVALFWTTCIVKSVSFREIKKGKLKAFAKLKRSIIRIL